MQTGILIICTLIVVGFCLLVNEKSIRQMRKIKEENNIQRWSIGTADFKFLIESYLDSLQYDSMDAKEIRRELLEQIRKVCPDWDDTKIIVHERVG